MYIIFKKQECKNCKLITPHSLIIEDNFGEEKKFFVCDICYKEILVKKIIDQSKSF